MPSPTPPDAADELFGLAPDAFIEARDTLAAQLREADDRTAAKAVKALRRPTVVAWAANQVARHSPDIVEELLATGDALVRAQRRLLSGVRGADVRAPARARRDAVDAALDAAVDQLRTIGVSAGAHRDKLVATFEAASLGGADADRLRAGRLDRDLRPTDATGLGGGLTVVPDQDPSEAVESKPEPPKKARSAKATPATRAAEAAEAAAERARVAREDADRARAAADDARAAADQAEEPIRTAEATVAEAASALEAARAEVERAEAALSAARAEVERATSERESAQARLAEAEKAAAGSEDAARAAEADAEDLAEDARRAAARDA